MVFVFNVGSFGGERDLTDTIKENREFRRAYHRGKCHASPLLVTYVLKRRNGIRIGITTGKKVGNAVARSRARRIIRAAWREVQPEVCAAADIVFVARARTPMAKSTDLVPLIRRHLKAEGLLAERVNDDETSAD